MKYSVDIKFSAYFTVDVEAESKEKAEKKCKQAFREAEFPKETKDFEIWNVDVLEADIIGEVMT